jgi:L-asparagine transporter-like permease
MKDWTKLEKTVIITIFFPGMNSPIYWTCNKIVQLQKDKQQSKKHTHKTKDRVTRTPLKTFSGFVLSILLLKTFNYPAGVTRKW